MKHTAKKLLQSFENQATEKVLSQSVGGFPCLYFLNI